MRKNKINSYNITQEQGDTIKRGLGALIDILVVLTGGKPIGGRK